MSKSFLLWSVAALAFASSIVVYPWLPTVMPIHFDAHGHANGFASRAVGAFLLPIVIAPLPLVARVRQSATVVSITAVFLFVLHVLVLRAALGDGNIGDIVWVALGLMFVALGLALPRVRRNRYVGIRTPWSMSSDEAWAQTHRAGSRTMVIGGAALALAPNVPLRIMALFFVTFVPIAQSWWIARKVGT